MSGCESLSSILESLESSAIHATFVNVTVFSFISLSSPVEITGASCVTLHLNVIVSQSSSSPTTVCAFRSFTSTESSIVNNIVFGFNGSAGF